MMSDGGDMFYFTGRVLNISLCLNVTPGLTALSVSAVWVEMCLNSQLPTPIISLDLNVLVTEFSLFQWLNKMCKLAYEQIKAAIH